MRGAPGSVGLRARTRSGSTGLSGAAGSASPPAGDPSLATVALTIEVCLCLAVGAACGLTLYQRGLGVETVGLLLVWEYGLYRVAAPLLSDLKRAKKMLLHSAQARADGFLIGQLCLPIVFAGNLLTWGRGHARFWQAVCLSMHATVITKPVRRASASYAAGSLLLCCAMASYFGLGGGYAHMLVCGTLFDALFRAASTRLSTVASPGEALILSSGVSIYFVDTVGFTIRQVWDVDASTARLLFATSMPRTQVESAVQVLLCGAFLVAVGLYPMLVLERRAPALVPTPDTATAAGGPRAATIRARVRARSGSSDALLVTPPTPVVVAPVELGRRHQAWFAVVVGLGLAAVMLPWLQLLLGQDAVHWLVEYLQAVPARLGYVVFWALVLVVVVLIHPTSDKLGLRNIVVRKVFHLVALIMFVPAMITQYDMLYLSFGIATAVLLLVEYIRLFRMPPFGSALHRFMSAYLDHKDEGPLILTHIYLLLGCAIPVWMCGSGPTQAAPGVFPAVGVNRCGLPSYAGIISLGVGDAVAAVVGSTWGHVRWWGTHKTVAGTASAAVAMVVSTLLLHVGQGYVCPTCAPVWPQTWLGGALLLASVVVVCLMETFTTQIDNLVVPLYFYALVQLGTALSEQ